MLCCVAPCHAAQPVDDVLRYDFTGIMPSDITLVDADSLEPSSDISPTYGFKVGTPWVCYYMDKEQNYVAASTSWYKQGGTSSDWLILPPVAVETAEAVVKWRAKASNKRFADGYAVYVSEENDASVDGFDQSHPLFSLGSESGDWTSHSVSLAAYQGKTIRVAFVNNSTDCAMLYLDDVFVGVPQAVFVQSATDKLVKAGEPFAVKATVSTDLDVAVKGFTVGCRLGDETLVKDFPDRELKPGETFTVDFEPESTVALGDEASFTLWAEHEGQRSEQAATVTACLQRMVAEELTGAWCGFCVRGTVYMDSMKTLHPDQFIGIAVYGGDFLQVDDYLDYVYKKASASGYPTSIVNRDKTLGADPQTFPAAFDLVMKQPLRGYVGLQVSEVGPAQYKLSATATLNSDSYAERYRMAYALIENDVYEEGDSRYRQANSYADGAYGEMGGYEDKPRYVTDVHFQDVVRGSIGDAAGMEGSLPTVVRAGQPYLHEQAFTLPGSVLNPANVEVVAMLVDTNDGTIVNAAKLPLLSSLSGMEKVRRVGERIGIYSLTGRRIPDGGIRQPGIYIVREAKGGAVVTRKVVME